VPASPGQTSVVFSVDPVDPATLGPPPPGLLLAGNAYRIQGSYRPSGGKVDTLGGRSSVGLIYPLLATAVADPAGHLVLASADGRSWQRLRSTDTPGTHQVSAGLGITGYVVVAVPPAGAGGGSGGDGRGRVLLLATAAAALLVLAAVLARRRLAAAGASGRRGRRPTQAPRQRTGGTGRPGGADRAGGAGRPGPTRKPPGRNPAKRRRHR
jgi:hypothetical protein